MSSPALREYVRPCRLGVASSEDRPVSRSGPFFVPILIARHARSDGRDLISCAAVASNRETRRSTLVWKGARAL